MKKRSKKGFTLAELLIVIAIIAVLVAIMLPVFGAQLNKARAAAELANVRAKYAELVADAMLGDSNNLTDVTSEVEIKLEDLGSALQYSSSQITVTDGTPSVDASGTAQTEAPGSIRVEYKGYSGEFKTDGDVKITGTSPFIKS